MCLRTGRQALALLAVIGLAAALITGPSGASVASKAKGSKLTFSGAVTGKSKGGQVNCVESTQTKGLQLSVSLNNFKLPKFANANLSISFAGANYSPGAHQFGGFTAASTGVAVTFSPGGGTKGWAGGEGTGTATLNADKKSGKIVGDLNEGSGIAPTGGLPVHVTGTFKCGKVEKF